MWRKTCHCTTLSTKLIYCINMFLINYLSGNRAQRFNTSNIYSCHWTQTWAYSVQFLYEHYFPKIHHIPSPTSIISLCISYTSEHLITDLQRCAAAEDHHFLPGRQVFINNILSALQDEPTGVVVELHCSLFTQTDYVFISRWLPWCQYRIFKIFPKFFKPKISNLNHLLGNVSTATV